MFSEKKRYGELLMAANVSRHLALAVVAALRQTALVATSSATPLDLMTAAVLELRSLEI